jgi:hypothetical protein
MPLRLASISPGKPVDAVAPIFSCTFLPLSEFGGNPGFYFATSLVNPTSSEIGSELTKASKNHSGERPETPARY